MVSLDAIRLCRYLDSSILVWWILICFSAGIAVECLASTSLPGLATGVYSHSGIGSLIKVDFIEIDMLTDSSHGIQLCSILSLEGLDCSGSNRSNIGNTNMLDLQTTWGKLLHWLTWNISLQSERVRSIAILADQSHILFLLPSTRRLASGVNRFTTLLLVWQNGLQMSAQIHYSRKDILSQTCWGFPYSVF
jgi:hypothetical protein